MSHFKFRNLRSTIGRRAWTVCGVVLASWIVTGRAQTTAEPQPDGPQVSVQLNPTAIWPGMPFEYQVSLVYPKSIDIIQDNLKKENLHLEPFTLLDLRSASRAAGDVTRLDVVLTLTALDRPEGEATIPVINIYYATRRAGVLGKGNEFDTHTLTLPERKIGIRSTLTSDAKDIRDRNSMRSSSTVLGWLWLPGWILLAVAAALVGRRVYSEKRGASAAVNLQNRKLLEQRAVQSLGPLDIAGAEGPDAERLEQASRTLRELLSAVLEIDAQAWTSDELKSELEGRGLPANHTESLCDLLRACDTARYASREARARTRNPLPSSASCRAAVERLVQL